MSHGPRRTYAAFVGKITRDTGSHMIRKYIYKYEWVGFKFSSLIHGFALLSPCNLLSTCRGLPLILDHDLVSAGARLSQSGQDMT